MPIYNGLNVNNKKDIFFSREDVFKKNVNIDDDAQSYGSKKVNKYIIYKIYLIVIYILYY